ncbi:IS110 family transposase [Sphingobium sp. EP60837]|uniref:IS110 family transposase n=1 Tax=Sphingobium sp. EP60837 TaxID=1855519 RepID=UPI00083248EB|nr:IS110 family transposase [Sphingobium sp. EP60837]
MTNPIAQTVGIDVSKATLDVYAHPADCERKFANSSKGHGELIEWLSQWPIDRIAYEATGAYHRQLEQALSDLPCVKLNPARARRFAQAAGTLAKTDKIDAIILARMAVTLQPPVRAASTPQQVKLSEMISARDGLVRDKIALQNQAKNLTLPLLKRQHKTRLDQIERHIDQVDAAIAAIIAADPALARRHEIISSIAGVGIRTADQLVATMPELGALDSKQAASLAGLAPVTRQSGQWKGRSFIQGGRANVRRALYMPALVAARYNPELKAKYQSLITAGKPAKVAVVTLMRKLIVMANALLRADRLWVEKRA